MYMIFNKKHLEKIYLSFNNECIAKLKSILKRAINYRYWFEVLIKVRQNGGVGANFGAIDYILSLKVMDADKTLLIYAAVGYV